MHARKSQEGYTVLGVRVELTRERVDALLGCLADDYFSGDQCPVWRQFAINSCPEWLGGSGCDGSSLGEHDESACTDWGEDCCADPSWGEPQSCARGYVAIPGNCTDYPGKEWCPDTACYGCYPAPEAVCEEWNTDAACRGSTEQHVDVLNMFFDVCGEACLAFLCVSMIICLFIGQLPATRVTLLLSSL